MDQGSFTDYRVHLWLADITKLHIGLNFANPYIAGAYASEVFGGSYGRMECTFSAPDSRVIFNETTLVFKGLPSVRLTHISGWDAKYNGNMEFLIPLATPTTVLAGKSYEIQANELAISLP
jgi:hypothetical protein